VADCISLFLDADLEEDRAKRPRFGLTDEDCCDSA
jgi:hypothetical protein